MSPHPRKAKNNAKKAVEKKYEFLEDEEEDPFAPDEDSEGDYVPEEEKQKKVKQPKRGAASKKGNKNPVSNDDQSPKSVPKDGKSTKPVPKGGRSTEPVSNDDQLPKSVPKDGQLTEPIPKDDQTTKPVLKGREKGSAAKKDDQMKLANIIEDEEIIYNLNHKLHSNLSAMSAAWERVAKKMNKSGKHLFYFFVFVIIQFCFQQPNAKSYTKVCVTPFAIVKNELVENPVTVVMMPQSMKYKMLGTWTMFFRF